MSEVKHDYKDVLEESELVLNGELTFQEFASQNWDAIIHALKLAAVVTGELSEGEDACSYIFKKMIEKAVDDIAQAEKEIG